VSLVVFRGVRLLDPATGLDGPGSLLVRDGRIEDVHPGAPPSPPAGAAIVEGNDAVLAPGLVDLRVATGEPGSEHRETIASAALAASAGGVTTLALQPDTEPALDEPALLQFVARRAAETGRITALPYATATKGGRGTELSEMGLLREAGAAGFTDGPRAIGDARLMRLALSYARAFDALVLQHAQDPSLSHGGAVTEGVQATRLGLPAIPAEAEAIQIERDLALLRLTGGRLHFTSVSTGSALDAIRRAKDEGLRVTCDTAPPYFDLNETALGAYSAYAKLSPPLRLDSDRRAVAAALADGTIDAIASDHCPQDEDGKHLPFASATTGGVGLETLLAVTLTQVHTGTVPLLQALGLLTHRPAALLGAQAGRLAKGAPADLVLFDPDRGWQVRAARLRSKSRNTPFDGRPLQGRVLGTWKAGIRVFEA